MKKIGLLFTLLLFSLAVQAQNTTLKQIENKVASLKIFKASVVFSTQGAKGDAASYNGEMFVKGKYYSIHFGQMEIFSDGETIWTYTPSRSEVIIEKASTRNGIMSSPTSFLSVSERDFSVLSNGTMRIGNTSYKTITLSPKGTEVAKSVTNVVVAYQANYIPKKVIITTKDNLKISILLNKVTLLSFMTDAAFTFDTSKAKEIIDFR
ncbi:MAG: outer membrane lipoprotein carrier protein LolA [Rikenellaceae bacterium]